MSGLPGSYRDVRVPSRHESTLVATRARAVTRSRVLASQLLEQAGMTRAYGSGRKPVTVRRPKIRSRHPGITALGFTCWRLVPTYERGAAFAILRVGETANSMAAFRRAR